MSLSSRISDLWTVWGIQLLVAASIACKIVLTILGSRRKYMTAFFPDVVIWATYLLLYYLASIALGKLTVLRIDDPKNPGYDVVLQGLLAPLLLMQLGYPDSITAYSVEDNRLGLRQMGNIGVTWVVVVWILFRCGDSSSPISRLYFPLLVVGIIKSAGWFWALKSVYQGWTVEDEAAERKKKQAFEALPEDEKFKYAKDILNAYYRFDHMKPHIVQRDRPLLRSDDWLSMDNDTADRILTITEIELNFMFDVLYTKAPILYTKRGFIGRFIGFFCLLSALCGFAGIFKDAFLIDMYVTYTYTLLMAVTSLELYQISMLAFSDWAVVKMSVYLNVPLVRRLLPFLAKQCMKQRRWSRSVGKLSLLDRKLLCKECPKPIDTVLEWFYRGEFVTRNWSRSRQPMPLSVMLWVVQKITDPVQNITNPEEKRYLLSFKKQGPSGSSKTTFDRNIIIWHIATEILLSLESENSDACTGSKLLSGYMIYLLALHPYTLSLNTADITLEFACCTLKPLFTCREDKEAISMMLSPDGCVPQCKETRITRDWDVLSEVRELVADLRTMDNKWELIGNFWVEMLCHAATKCHPYHHEKLLRKGGELITHVWLLLAHKTDKYRSIIDEPSEVNASPPS